MAGARGLLAVLAVAALAGTACDPGAGAGTPTPRDGEGSGGPPATTTIDDNAGSGGSSGLQRDGGPPDGGGLERRETTAVSAVERRVAELLSHLDAAQRARDTVVTLPNRVLFDFDEHVLRPGAADLLDDLAEVLAYYQHAPVAVHGHTDWIGDAAYNQQLSERRAQSVLAYLVEAGIPADRLQAHGFGESEPVATNDTDEGRQQNRRVEVIVTDVELLELPDEG